MAGQPLPASGAWQPGDPVGHRQFLEFTPADRARRRRHPRRRDRRLRDVGDARRQPQQRDPAVPCVDRRQSCGRARWATAIPARVGGRAPSGPGLAIDTDRWFVVCANVLGGCQGSTGPASPHPVDGKPYGSRFPVVTIRDMVRAQARLADHLGDPRVALGRRRLDGRDAGARVGDHLPGSRALDRARSPRARRPRRSRSRGAPSAGARIRMDPNVARRRLLRRRRRATGPWEGLAVARMVAQVTFRSDNVFTERFGRELADGATLRRRPRSVAAVRGRALPRPPRREAGAPVRRQQLPHHRQGDGPARRRPRARRCGAGDGADRGADAGDRASPATCSTRRTSSARSATCCSSNGTPCEYVEIDSPHGHDAFLINLDQLSVPLGEFIDAIGKA